jgi:hypothetical protein
MTYTPPSPLVRTQRELEASFGAAVDALHELGEPIDAEGFAVQALDFLILVVEELGAHHADDVNRDWESFLIDFVHVFSYDEHGELKNALATLDLDDIVLDCCALDDDEAPVTSAARIERLRNELLEVRMRQNDFSLG